MTAGRSNAGGGRSRDWCTPPDLLDAVRSFFGGRIGLDPCSNRFSTVGAETEWSLPDRDGLSAVWDSDSVFVNPPYGYDSGRGTGMSHWLSRCREAHEEYGAEVLALVPVATNTGHWKRSVFGSAAAVCFLAAPRLKFHLNGMESPKGAPMACAMVYWGTDPVRFGRAFAPFGACVRLALLPDPRECPEA